MAYLLRYGPVVLLLSFSFLYLPFYFSNKINAVKSRQLVSCGLLQRNFSLDLLDSVVLDSVPSASGAVMVNDSLYIIGDDASGIYKLSLSDYGWSKTSFLTGDTKGYRIPKPVKHDFESAAIARIDAAEYLVAFGSGTLSPYRDSLLLAKIADINEQKRFSLSSFYHTLLQQNRLARKDLNIEGIAIAGDRLYILNRGDNSITETSWQQFIEYTRSSPGNKKFPSIKTHRLKLPSLHGVQAGMSGACTLNDTTLLLTASLENTTNWTQDGEILGSYILIVKLATQGPELVQAIPIKNKNAVMPVKLESLDIISANDSQVLIAAVADNDNGSSTVYRFLLR